MENRDLNFYESRSIEQSYAFSKLMRSVYIWMTLALCITGLTAAYIATSPGLMYGIINNSGLVIGLVIAELAVVMILSGAIHKLSFMAATLLFILYSLLNGATLSTIFMAYELGSIAQTFYVTAGTFAATSLVGYFTKSNMDKVGNYLLMALIGLIIATVVNIFVASTALEWIITYAGVVIFIGLTIYDTNKIKRMLKDNAYEISDSTQKMALMGSLTLYLDFVNLFIYLLRIFGDRK